MINTHRREKLVQAIVYFANATELCGKTKLFKLLYLLDFDHFRATGRSVTGLAYYAWEMGPVPVELKREWDDGFGKDLAAAIWINRNKVVDYCREQVIAELDFDDQFFSRRELKILEGLANRYRYSKASDMVEVTHAENEAWKRVWQDGEGQNELIDYRLSLTKSPKDQRVLEAAQEYERLIRNIGAR